MSIADPNSPLFSLVIDGVRVATLHDPEYEEMFWCSYRVEPTTDEGDRLIHDEKTWELVRFSIEEINGMPLQLRTFSGGYEDFCSRKTNRLSFRSLWPSHQKSESLFARISNWAERVFKNVVGGK